jgi:hypothetical protein
MGIDSGTMEAIIREHARQPFFGKVYTLGRQKMPISPEDALTMFAALQVTPAITRTSELSIDTTTIEANLNRSVSTIRDVDFFRMLGFSEVYAIDFTDVEGAEIILDLNYPVPDSLAASCGLLVDGSLLDNIFDPTTGLKNIARLLMPGGRCFVHNMGNTRADYSGIPYTMFNPLWFFDYFVWNEFDYCQVYVTVYPGENIAPEVYAISLDHAARHWDAGLIRPIVSQNLIALSVYAEKGPRSTWAKMPTQHAYRSEADWDRYIAIVEGYRAQQRAYIKFGAEGPIPADIPAGYLRVGPDGSTRYTGLEAVDGHRQRRSPKRLNMASTFLRFLRQLNATPEG